MKVRCDNRQNTQRTELHEYEALHEYSRVQDHKDRDGGR